VTSGGIRCSKGTPIIKKPNPSLLSKEEQQKKKKKNKRLDTEQIYGHGSPAGLDAESDRAGWLPAVSYCSALLCSALLWRLERIGIGGSEAVEYRTVVGRELGGFFGIDSCRKWQERDLDCAKKTLCVEKSVARIQPVKTANPSVRAMVNRKCVEER
jgi:hypothetical protein